MSFCEGIGHVGGCRSSVCERFVGGAATKSSGKHGVNTKPERAHVSVLNAPARWPLVDSRRVPGTVLFEFQRKSLSHLTLGHCVGLAVVADNCTRQERDGNHSVNFSIEL
jgi:hypothetical protein